MVISFSWWIKINAIFHFISNWPIILGVGRSRMDHGSLTLSILNFSADDILKYFLIFLRKLVLIFLLWRQFAWIVRDYHMPIKWSRLMLCMPSANVTRRQYETFSLSVCSDPYPHPSPWFNWWFYLELAVRVQCVCYEPSSLYYHIDMIYTLLFFLWSFTDWVLRLQTCCCLFLVLPCGCLLRFFFFFFFFFFFVIAVVLFIVLLLCMMNPVLITSWGSRCCLLCFSLDCRMRSIGRGLFAQRLWHYLDTFLLVQLVGLKMNYCGRSMSIVCRPLSVIRRAASQICFKAYSSYTPWPLTRNLVRSNRMTNKSKIAKLVPIGNPRRPPWMPSWKSALRFFICTERPTDS